MRFLHAADLHIDSPLRGLGRFDGAPLARLRGATRRALVRLVDLALDEQVAFVLIAGDLYDRDWQDFHTGLFVREQMVRLQRAGIRVFIVLGNHDARGVISREVPWPDNVKVFSSRSAETLRIDELNVALHGHSFPNREVPEDLVPGYPATLPGFFNIGLLHTSLVGAEGHDTYAPTTLATLKAKGYDYWALGHVHARQVVSEDHPRVVFPGNLQGRHARETGPKGCELVELQGGQLSARFVPLDVVRWHRVVVDLTGALSADEVPARVSRALQAAVAQADGAAPADDALHALRVSLVGETVLQAFEARQPGALAALVQAAAQDVVGAELWIEKVQLQLRSPLDRQRLAEGGDALAELVRGVDRLAADGPALAALCQATLAEVLDKLPAELSAALVAEQAQGAAPDDVPRLADAASLQALLRDAEATLLARLGNVDAREARP